jgi:hypothetical protein
MADAINYHVVNTDNKWKILRTHWRYSWWGEYYSTSILGSWEVFTK